MRGAQHIRHVNIPLISNILLLHYSKLWAMIQSWNFHMKQSKCKTCSSSIPVSVLCRHRQQQEEKLRAVVMLLSSPLAVDQAVCAASTRTHSSSSPFLPSSSTQLLSGEGTDAASQWISFTISTYLVFRFLTLFSFEFCFVGVLKRNRIHLNSI